jgi:hypothetical protein
MEDATETIEALLDILHLSHMYAPKVGDVSAAGPVSTASQGRSSGSSSRPAADSADSDLLAASGVKMRRRLSEVSGADRIEEASNFPCQPPCIAHEVFGIEYVDLPRCTFCAATGEPHVVSSFLYRVYVAELLATQGRSDAASGTDRSDTYSAVSDQVQRITTRLAGTRPELQSLLQSLCQRSVEKKCPECNSRNTMVSERWLTRRPHTFMVSLVWPSTLPSREALWLVVSSIQSHMQMESIFASRHKESNAPSRQAEERPQQYLLRGLICYYGMHYIAFFYCWARKKWVLFDDTRVREEKDWSSVVSIIVSGQYVPTLLFYERDQGGITKEDIEELAQQVRNLEDRQSPCVLS